MNKQEINYILNLIRMAKESLDDCCDEFGMVRVDFMTQTEVNQEYTLIASIEMKLGELND